jgi:protein farnesyltransferase/geranylgeranyltransferase type-1 subunit alpha
MLMADRRYTPFSERPEYSDVVPIAQDDGPNPPVCIAYTPQYIDTMNYFRALYAAGERSERALEVTSAVVRLNAANYTAWHLRRLCLEAVRTKDDLRVELEFVERLMLDSPKNYQIWFHR